jgi:hypothetical protein
MEKRVSKRKPVLRLAKIYGPDHSPICGCTVQDLSDTGARLSVEKRDLAMREIPAEFILSFTPNEEALNESRSVTRKCQTVWMRGNQLGAHFPDRRRQR